MRLAWRSREFIGVIYRSVGQPQISCVTTSARVWTPENCIDGGRAPPFTLCALIGVSNIQPKMHTWPGVIMKTAQHEILSLVEEFFGDVLKKTLLCSV